MVFVLAFGTGCQSRPDGNRQGSEASASSATKSDSRGAPQQRCVVGFLRPRITVHFCADPQDIIKTMAVKGLERKEPPENAQIEFTGTGEFAWGEHLVVVEKDSATVDGVKVASQNHVVRNVVAWPGKQVRVDASLPWEGIVHEP